MEIFIGFTNYMVFLLVHIESSGDHHFCLNCSLEAMDKDYIFSSSILLDTPDHLGMLDLVWNVSRTTRVSHLLVHDFPTL